MQFLNIATAITLYTFIAVITLPFILTAIYVLSGGRLDLAGVRRHSVGQSSEPIDYPSCPVIEVPDMLGPELDGDAILEAVDEALARPVRAIAQEMNEPVAKLTIPIESVEEDEQPEPEQDLSKLNIRQLKEMASKAKIKGYSHMRKAQLIEALS